MGRPMSAVPAIRDKRIRTHAAVRQLRDSACCRIARNKLRVLHWPWGRLQVLGGCHSTPQ